MPTVGGKNASLGEMVFRLSGAGIRVLRGFATSAEVFRDFLAVNGLNPRLAAVLAHLDAGEIPLDGAGRTIRAAIFSTDSPYVSRQAILDGYRELARRIGEIDPAVAVRSGATAEDLPGSRIGRTPCGSEKAVPIAAMRSTGCRPSARSPQRTKPKHP